MKQIITLKNISAPKKSKLDKDVMWICESLGFNQGRDTENTSFSIINALLKEIGKNDKTSTEVLAKSLNIADQKVNYHLRTISNSGFIVRERKSICLREGSVKAAVEEMRLDANRIFDNISKIAEDIDKKLKLKNRYV